MIKLKVLKYEKGQIKCLLKVIYQQAHSKLWFFVQLCMCELSKIWRKAIIVLTVHNVVPMSKIILFFAVHVKL